VSHHPPVSAFFVTNRQEGFTVSSTILAKSKFYGNSTSAILEGTATLSLLPRGEEYFMTMPYAHCKGILMGTMTVELGGKVTIECTKTGYSTEIEFKLRVNLEKQFFYESSCWLRIYWPTKIVNATLSFNLRENYERCGHLQMCPNSRLFLLFLCNS
jgi:hypothetical protein